MTPGNVNDWLTRYGTAWQEKNAEAFVELFSPDAVYRWTPFSKPLVGRDELGAAVRAAIADQRDIRFDFTPLGATASLFIAHWTCEFDRVSSQKRVHLDGIFQLSFDHRGLCQVFREWWHSDEPESDASTGA